MDDEKNEINDDKEKESNLSSHKTLISTISKILSNSNYHRTYKLVGAGNTIHRTAYGKKWKKGDIITCFVNIEEKYIEFFLNDISMGKAFENIDFFGNIYISITCSNRESFILLNNDKININDNTNWIYEGKMDINDKSKIEKLCKLSQDVKKRIDKLNIGDKIALISADKTEIIQCEIYQINKKTEKYLLRHKEWEWIKFDSERICPSKKMINNIYNTRNDSNEQDEKLNIKFSGLSDWCTATLKMPLNKYKTFEYSVKLITFGCLQIGFSDDKFKPDTSIGCGDDDNSWAFDGDRILKWGKKNKTELAYEKQLMELSSIIPNEFDYDKNINYIYAIERSIFNTFCSTVCINDILAWFFKHCNDKTENIYASITINEINVICDKYKDLGNKLYKKKKYYAAIEEYTKSIYIGSIYYESNNKHIYYSNRSICLSKIYAYKLALSDANYAILINNKWSKGYLRAGYALLQLHRFKESIKCYKKGINKCDKTQHKLLNFGLDTAIKYEKYICEKEKYHTKITFYIFDPSEENIKKDIDFQIEKVNKINIYNSKLYKFQDLIEFETFGWKLIDEKENININQWKCDNYPITLTVTHYNKQCDITKKPIDINMHFIRPQQRENLIKSGIDSGLIISENFQICKAPSIYCVEVLIKTIITSNRPKSGYIYWIKIPFMHKYFELKLETTYEMRQTTGHRDSVMLAKIAKKVKMNVMELMKYWNEDPYDSLYALNNNNKLGALMNISERKEYDKLFPYHPLSILRQKLIPIFKNSIKIDSNKAKQMELL